MDLVFLSLQGLRISRYPGEDAFLSSHKVGDCTQHRFSSCKGFLLPPHPQVGTPVSRKRFARSYATLLIKDVYTKDFNLFSFSPSIFWDPKKSYDPFSPPSLIPHSNRQGNLLDPNHPSYPLPHLS